jgi:hypothetical protein
MIFGYCVLCHASQSTVCSPPIAIYHPKDRRNRFWVLFTPLMNAQRAPQIHSIPQPIIMLRGLSFREPLAECEIRHYDMCSHFISMRLLLLKHDLATKIEIIFKADVSHYVQVQSFSTENEEIHPATSHNKGWDIPLNGLVMCSSSASGENSCGYIVDNFYA